MNQFTVPQFIDVEDKIFGPVTVRQFLIILASGLIHFIVYKLVDTGLFVVFLVVFGGFTIILAFAKINGQAFHYFLLNIFQTLRRPSLRIWNKQLTNEALNELRRPIKPEARPPAPEKHVSASRIRDLSLQVNTGGYFKPE
jgi:hypothetical protein